MSVTPLDESAEHPEEFRIALASLRAAVPRPEITVREGDPSTAPRRLAPHAVTFAADVTFEGTELATGRLILLYDPAGQEGWEGTFRTVTFVRADLEPEMAADPLLLQVGWSWLIDALHERDASYREPAGTITRSASESFGALAERPVSTEMELRASWTPVDADCGPHLLAWCEVLSHAAGLPPLPPGVTPLRGSARR